MDFYRLNDSRSSNPALVGSSFPAREEYLKTVAPVSQDRWVAAEVPKRVRNPTLYLFQPLISLFNEHMAVKLVLKSNQTFVDVFQSRRSGSRYLAPLASTMGTIGLDPRQVNPSHGR